MAIGTIIGIIVGAVVLIIALWVIASYNGFVRMRNAVREAFSTMDVYLKKRHDLIPNLVATVKGYAAHEEQTLNKVIEARNAAVGASDPGAQLAAESQLSSSLRSLFALAESYPDLKANTNFLELQQQLQSMEGEIAQSRKYYNGTVKNLNNKVESFPGNIVAGIFGVKREPFFEVADAAERENVTVSF